MLLSARNLTRIGVEICGRVIPPRRTIHHLERAKVEEWIEASGENARRLRDMLAVTDADGHPVDDLVPPEEAQDSPVAGGEGDGAGDDGKETEGAGDDEASRLVALDDGSGKKPTAKAVGDLLGRPVSAAERDELWGAYLAGLDG